MTSKLPSNFSHSLPHQRPASALLPQTYIPVCSNIHLKCQIHFNSSFQFHHSPQCQKWNTHLFSFLWLRSSVVSVISLKGTCVLLRMMMMKRISVSSSLAKVTLNHTDRISQLQRGKRFHFQETIIQVPKTGVITKAINSCLN